MKRKIAFIINPISGPHKHDRVADMIDDLIDSRLFLYDIVLTEYAGQASQLAKEFAAKDYYAVIAVGGDGTVNEVANGLIGTNTALGIIPSGSGNGLARHLGVSTNIKYSIKKLNTSESISIDYGVVNNIPFFSTFGLGFDAVVSHSFNNTKRGLIGYAKSVIKVFFQYKLDTYHCFYNDVELTTNAFLINIANAGQYGYNTYIAPHANLQDGKLDLVVVHRFPIISAVCVILRLFTKSIDKSRFVKTLPIKNITIIRENDTLAHIDGTPLDLGKELQVKIVEKGLKVLLNR